MRPLLLVLALAVTPVLAADPALRPSARLLFKQPEMMQAGKCVVYEEGGSGWIMTDPVYYLKGKVVSARVEPRNLARCPVVAGKNIEQYSRAEFNRHARAFPCVAPDTPERDEQIGVVTVRVESWETPHAIRAANAGRLYRGMFIDQPLNKGLEVELEADLLGVCTE
jgi:hypothetical protein